MKIDGIGDNPSDLDNSDPERKISNYAICAC